ncbi:MAG: semialdehyde dehydrogenase [Cyclobacteriaceae bacterium]|nr:semialdehyde dehydrogenase [Cyclobacteriaceae bacterium]
MTKVVLVGAGGKMGCRITSNLKNSKYAMSYLELSPEGQKRLADLGVSVSIADQVLQDGDIVILAVPDVAIETVSAQVIPQMKPGALLVTLDPAAAFAGKIFPREDIAIYVTHPAHPSIFNWEPDEQAQRDFFGGSLARQVVVSAIMQGSEADYAIGDELSRLMYAPVTKNYKITVEQMGLLEPALVETLCSTLQVIVREALDIVIEKGVPADAARDFLLGHLNIQLAVLYDQIPGAVFSDAANKAIVRGKPLLIKESWREVFEPDNVMEQIRDIT